MGKRHFLFFDFLLPVAGILLIGRILAQRFDYLIFHFLDNIRAFGLGYWFAESELRVRLLRASPYIFAFFPAAGWAAWIRVNVEIDRATGSIRLDRPIFLFCSGLAGKIRGGVRSPKEFSAAIPTRAPIVPPLIPTAPAVQPARPIAAPSAPATLAVSLARPAAPTSTPMPAAVPPAPPAIALVPSVASSAQDFVRSVSPLVQPASPAVPSREAPVLRAEPVLTVKPPADPPDDLMPPAPVPAARRPIAPGPAYPGRAR